MDTKEIATSISPACICPRDRLLERGGQGLSDAELLGLLLKPSRPATERARAFLEEVGGLIGLLALPEVKRGRGQKHMTLVLRGVVEFARRLAKAELLRGPCMTDPDIAARYLFVEHFDAGQEVLGAIFLDTHRRIIDVEDFVRGTLQRAAAEPRPFLKAAIMRNAARMILFHNHPSGNPTPSVDDIAFSQRIRLAARVVGVTVDDHLVIGTEGRFTSIKRLRGWR